MPMKNVALFVLVFSLPAAHLHAEDSGPLSSAIDAAIAERAGGPVVGPTSDAEFLRRVSLDFTGCIPTVDDVRRFLADSSPNKRTQLIDRLLDSPAFPRRMSEALTVMMLERREGKAVSDDAWRDYLREAFVARKPWDQLVRELLNADGSDERTRPAIRFFVDGGRADPHVITQDVARLFLGLNLQCAQCHDHPSIRDYRQAHYYGLLAFLGQGKLVNDKQNRPFLRESVLKTKLDFVSVFIPGDKRATGPKLLDGDELPIPEFKTGEEFSEPAKDGLPGIPKFEPRKLLGLPLTSHRQFARNAVNRFWFLLMGRGLVHPLDLHHSQNPPSHPELLERLTDDFITHHYDVRWLLREIALTATYQRSSQVQDAAGPDSENRYRVAILRPLSAEQLARSVAEALGRRSTIESAPSSASTLTYKDYANGRSPLPTNWRDVMAVFAGAFGQPPGIAEVEFAPSVEQSVFLAHDRLVRDWLAPQPGSFIKQLSQMSDLELANEIFLKLLSRPATEEELNDVIDILKLSGDRRVETIQDLCLSILTSTEFRLTY